MSDTYSKAISDAEKTISDVCSGRKCLPHCLDRLRRTGSPGPCGRGGPGRRALFWLWVLAVAGFMVAVFKCFGAGLCVWNGDGYVCNGSGSYVYVTGGGGGGGDVVITNIVGTCTNCVAMSPEYVRSWKQSMTRSILDELHELDNVRNSCYVALDILSPYTKKYPISGLELSQPGPITNFVETTPGVKNSKPFKAANAVYDDYAPTLSVTILRRWIAAYDGAAYSYNEVADSVIESTNYIRKAERDTYAVQTRLSDLTGVIDQLSEEECTAQWDGPASESPDYGSGPVTNQVNGDWCTYEQGQMMINTLNALEEWIDKEEKYLQSLTNWVSTVNYTIIANLNTTYNAIPDENGLSDTWQNIYLDGQPQPWGYQPTNILARIELLLYGLTGVGTNHTSVVDTEEAQEDGTDNMSDAVSDAVSEADFSRQQEQLSSIKDAMLRFCDAFYVENPNLSNARFTPEIRFRLQTTSGEEFDTTFEPVTLPQSQVGTVEAIIETIRVACIVFYYVLMAYCVFSFWRTIAKYVVFSIKWAQELLTSIFAD